MSKSPFPTNASVVERLTVGTRLLLSLAGLFSSGNALAQCEKISETTLRALGQERVLRAFTRAASKLGVYRSYLAKQGVDPTQIRSLATFLEQVPTITKQDIFVQQSTLALVDGAKASDIESVIISSGTSTQFSYSIGLKQNAAAEEQAVDTLLDYFFEARQRPPFLINALPMGVSFPSKYPTAHVGTRFDSAVHLIKTFHSAMAQIVVVTDPHTAKNIVEYGKDHGIVWGDISISFAIGGTWVAHSLVTYLENELNLPGRATNRVFQTMGLSELGLNIFFAPPELTRVRGALDTNRAVRKHLFGDDLHAVPQLMYYIPTRHFIEVLNPDADGVGEIVITDLNLTSAAPLIRYRTGDWGKVLSHEEITSALAGMTEELKLQLPIVAFTSRATDAVMAEAAHDFEEAMYRARGVPGACTGHFFLRPAEGHIRAEVHLQRGKTSTDDLVEAVRHELAHLTDQRYEIVPMSYEDYRHDMELTYERKWKLHS